MDTVKIDGIEYVPKDTTEGKKYVVSTEGKKYVICRTHSAGVFAGYLQKRDGQEVTLLNARRIWYWEGAATLSQLAMEGTSKPESCKFPTAVDKILLLHATELLDCTRKAQESIEGVPVWKA